MTQASTPEPPPKPGQELVTPALLAFLRDPMGAPPYVLDLVRQRDAFGRAKYGQGLMTFDGRDTYEDLRQELGDALQYTFKLWEEVRAGGWDAGHLEGLGRLKVISEHLDWIIGAIHTMVEECNE